MLLGSVLALTAICAGTYLILKGHGGSGLAAILTALGGLIGAFMYRAYAEKRWRETPKEAGGSQA